jgi:hypothetical protein
MTSMDSSDLAVCEVLRPPATELLAAYLAADYCVEAAAQSFRLRIGEPSLPSETWLAARGAQRAVIVTAWNPQSHHLDPEQNDARHAELEALVRAAGIAFVPAANYDPAQKWPAEQGLCLLDPAPGLVTELLVRFAQYAAVVIERGCVARLEWHPAVAQLYCDSGIAPAE